MCPYFYGTDVARIVPDMRQVEARDFIVFLTDGEAPYLRSIGSSQKIFVIAGKQLGFEVVDYPKQNKRIYRHAS